HVLVEGQQDGGAPNHRMVAIADAGIDSERGRERAQHKPGEHQHEHDWKYPPAAPQRRAKPAAAGCCLSHQGSLKRIIRTDRTGYLTHTPVSMARAIRLIEGACYRFSRRLP